uniref:Uncharacterized protein n=1 Tax=Rhizophora mucronata TaxID=61149 RepID=A0A2P2R561_RHIMU
MLLASFIRISIISKCFRVVKSQVSISYDYLRE